MLKEPARINRRDFLKLMGAFAGVGAAITACAPEQVPGPDPTRAVAPVVSNPATGVPPEPVLPPVALGIIALNRMGYGLRPGDLDAFNALGSTDEERLRNYVAQQLNPEAIDDSEFEARYAAAGFETLHKTQDELYYDHIANNQYDANDNAYWDWYAKPAYELVDATFLRAVYSKKQLVEVLADFWHNHFNVYFWQDDGVPLLVSYNRDVLRRHRQKMMIGSRLIEIMGKYLFRIYTSFVKPCNCRHWRLLQKQDQNQDHPCSRNNQHANTHRYNKLPIHHNRRWIISGALPFRLRFLRFARLRLQLLPLSLLLLPENQRPPSELRILEMKNKLALPKGEYAYRSLETNHQYLSCIK